MPSNPSFKASVAEWRTVIDALRVYADHLTVMAPTIEDEEEHLVAYDDMERLDRIIPSFEQQLKEYMDQVSASLDPPPSPPVP